MLAGSNHSGTGEKTKATQQSPTTGSKELTSLLFPLRPEGWRWWHPTPVLLPGKSHGPRSLVGCSPWGREESDMTERLHFHFSLSCVGKGNGNPLRCSCLENPRDGGAWWAAVYGVAQSRTRLKRLSSSSSRPERMLQWLLLGFSYCNRLTLRVREQFRGSQVTWSAYTIRNWGNDCRLLLHRACCWQWPKFQKSPEALKVLTGGPGWCSTYQGSGFIDSRVYFIFLRFYWARVNCAWKSGRWFFTWQNHHKFFGGKLEKWCIVYTCAVKTG